MSFTIPAGGFKRGELSVIAVTPNREQKTNIAQQELLKAIQRGDKVVFVSLELGETK